MPEVHGLQARGIEVRFGSLVAVAGVDLDVEPGRIVAVLGPSGCGKSTLLRAIAGLETLDAGQLTWAGDDITGTPVHERRFGMMFQDHALFPHLDVAANVSFGLRMNGVSRPDRAARVDELLARVGLFGIASRRVDQLSGGEAQRVALARALAPEPRLLLLDEPLSSVDRDRRDWLVADLQTIVRTTGTAAVHVTHDHDEALAIADELIVMRAGRVVQRGTPAEVWARPSSPFVAGFLGANVVDASVLGIRAASGRSDAGLQGALVAVRPEALHIGPTGPIAATITNRAFQRDHTRLRVITADGAALTVWQRPGSDRAPLDVGDEIRLTVDPGAVVRFP